MTTAEHQRRTAIDRSNRLCPGNFPMRKPGELTKQEMREMLHDAVVNTANEEIKE